ncbi:MAG: rhodanese-related sulfurtransferase [Verrucomicrobiota bacterium]
MGLYNRVNGKELKEKIQQSKEKRVTVSFYRYHHISDPQAFRDQLYCQWDLLNVLGRTYVAAEGINAQISVPVGNWDQFEQELYAIEFLDGVRLNVAVDDDGKSFFKLNIKVRPKIVSDGLNDSSFDVTKGGMHLDAEAFNELISQEGTVLVDMRNHYESEVGHFDGAICPDVDTFRESLPIIEEMLAEDKERPLVMYCTGGIRCEKASAWFKHQGFKDVYQLEGGIIKYARDVQEKGLTNKFRGKNFVFDERMGERISDEVIANCHQCGKPCDTHTNCKNVTCNLLFIQCDECAAKYDGCCSDDCQDFVHLPEEEQLKLRKGTDSGIRIFSKGRFNSQKTPS